MNPNREDLPFQLALTKPNDERAGFLDRECRNDAALRARLNALLAAHDQPDELLGAAAEGAAPTMKLDFVEEMKDEGVGERIGRYKILERSKPTDLNHGGATQRLHR